MCGDAVQSTEILPRIRRNTLLEGQQLPQLAAEALAPPGVGEILGEKPLNSDIVVVF